MKGTNCQKLFHLCQKLSYVVKPGTHGVDEVIYNCKFQENNIFVKKVQSHCFDRISTKIDIKSFCLGLSYLFILMFDKSSRHS